MTLCLYFYSAKVSPVSEAFETVDGSAWTVVTVCEVGYCSKTVAEVMALGSNVKGVRTGLTG